MDSSDSELDCDIESDQSANPNKNQGSFVFGDTTIPMPSRNDTKSLTVIRFGGSSAELQSQRSQRSVDFSPKSSQIVKFVQDLRATFTPKQVLLNSTRCLCLALNDLKSIPMSVQLLSRLLVLNLSDNNLTTCVGVECLTSLKFLNLSNNKLKSVFLLSKLPCLEELYISHNQIVSLPQLSDTLRLLDITNNKLSQESLEKMPKSLKAFSADFSLC